MAGSLSHGSPAAALLSIAIVALAGGCDRPHSTQEPATAVSNEISRALIGRQITVRGRFSLRGVAGPYIALDKQQVVYLVPRGSFTWGKSYAEMEGKLVVATGILKFFHPTDSGPADRANARPPEYFYFDAETAQLKLAGH